MIDPQLFISSSSTGCNSPFVTSPLSSSSKRASRALLPLPVGPSSNACDSDRGEHRLDLLGFEVRGKRQRRPPGRRGVAGQVQARTRHAHQTGPGHCGERVDHERPPGCCGLPWSSIVSATLRTSGDEIAEGQPCAETLLAKLPPRREKVAELTDKKISTLERYWEKKHLFRPLADQLLALEKARESENQATGEATTLAISSTTTEATGKSASSVSKPDLGRSDPDESRASNQGARARRHLAGSAGWPIGLLCALVVAVAIRPGLRTR